MDAVFQLPAPFAVIELGRALSALETHEQRQIRLAERIDGAEALVLMRVMGCAQREAALGSLYGRVLYDTFFAVVGRFDVEDPRRQQWRDAAETILDTGMLSLFDPPESKEQTDALAWARRMEEKEAPRGSLAAEGETLGRRKMLARTATGDVADRLARDPHPDVVETLLRNPRTRELLVVQLSARGLTKEDVLEVVARSRFQGSPRVMRALVQNPHCPPAISARFLPALARSDLVDVAHDVRLPEQTRRAARVVLDAKPPRLIR